MFNLSKLKKHYSAKKLLLVFCSLISLSLYTSHSFAEVPQVGGTYFTKYNFKFEKGRHVTTNYWRGELVPVNSKIEVVSFDAKKMDILVNGQQVRILNVKKHSQKTMEEVADNLLSRSPVSVAGKFSKDVLGGQLRLGMTKAEAIMTRGYPPAHKTYSTEADRWTYWSSRFIQMSILFENNRLTKGRGLR